MTEVRDHLSDKLNRSRLELEVKRSVRPTAIVALGLLLALAIGVYIASHVSNTLLASTYEASFEVDDVSGVVPGSHDVRFKGIPVGTITKVETEGTQPVLRVRIQDRYGRIFRDARAELRPNTALNDMFLDVVERGSQGAGEISTAHPLPAARTSSPVSVNEVLGVFEADARESLKVLLDNLGNGLEDRGARLRTAFAEVVPFLAVADRITGQLARRKPLTRRLVHNTGVLTAELGRRETQLRRLVTDGSATLTTLQDGSGDIDAVLRELPPTLTAVDSTVGAVDASVGDLNRAVRSLYPVADQLPAALPALRRINASAAPAVRSLQAPVKRLVPFARALRPLSADVSRAVTALAPQIDTVNYTVDAAAGCEKGIQGFFQWDASMSKFGDIRGPVPRGNVVAGAQSSGVLGDPSEFAPQACTPGKVAGGRPPLPKDER